ncbi:MAG: transglutaminase [Lachnospiraceae bacterium]|nr:transglutaminase [Lachnospiraceae bacterium]
MSKRHRITAAVLAAVLVLSPASVSTTALAETTTAATAQAAADGWKTVKGKTYYYQAGKKLTGTKKIDGKTYIFSKAGALIKNKKVYKAGKKYYRIDKKGVAVRFTGVEAMAAKRLCTKKINKNLKKAFKWSAMNFFSVPKCKSRKESKIAKYYGKFGFSNGVGDCYVQAYTFYWMAKVLGYDVKVVRGYVEKAGGRKDSHAWCEIKKKGKVYVYDPNFNKEYSQIVGNPNAGYAIRYGAKKTLKYYSPKKKLMK